MAMQTVVVLLLFLTADLSIGQKVTEDELDIVLLLDSTDRQPTSYFSDEQNFVIHLVDDILAVKPHARVGLYTFADTVHEEFALNTFDNADEMKRYVRYMWYSVGNMELSDALETMIEKAFTVDAGDRECVPNILIVATYSPLTGTSKMNALQSMLNKYHIQTIVLNMAGPDEVERFETLVHNSTEVITVGDSARLSLAVDTVEEILLTGAHDGGCGVGVLSAWSGWTKCSRTCGEGFMIRMRECVKFNADDKDCDDALTDTTPCSLANCTAPVDGKWTFWGSWSECSKSCEKGIQYRTRQCAQPAPQHGGKQCVGSTRQEKDCADFPCPNCGRQCPQGGQLSDSCDVCICTDITFFGKVLSDTNRTVEGAKIFLSSSKYKPLTQTDSFGSFRVESVCLMDENVYIEVGGHVPTQITPLPVNDTHWTLPKFKLETYVQPVFKVSPEDKVRIAGQSLSLCCEAIGKPLPTAYKWLKDGIELDGQGTDGTLLISATTTQDTGSYTCVAVTDAGTSQSEEADVQINAEDDNGDDTCGPPVEQIENLPDGCYVGEGDNMNTAVNVGTCGNRLCTNKNLHDNGSCSDYWPDHCCSASDFQTINVSCEGFSYNIQQVIACTCKPCSLKTVVVGRAFGRSNGTEVPLQLGHVIVSGEQVAVTSMTGVFKFEVKKTVKRIVATFHDEQNKRLADITKVITVSSGSSSFTTAVMPLRPTPVPFETNNGTEIHMGGDGDSLPPAAKLSIPPDSVVTADGEPFTGNVKASLHFMDPRKREDIEAANGDFVSESPDGARMPLKTFGMFQLGLQDDDGNQLSTNKPLKFSMDSSMFDVPLDENGDPDVALWSYDKNKGIWIEIAKLQKEQDTEIVDGRRKLLQSSTVFVVEYHPPNVPTLDLYNREYVKEWTGEYTNCDQSVKIYDYVEVKSPKGGACYVAVSIYSDLSLTETYKQDDIEITTYVQEMEQSNYLGSSTTKLKNDDNGRVCIPIFCDKRVYISVTRNGAERLYAGEHYLPTKNYLKTTRNNEVMFESRDYGDALDASSFPSDTIPEGPVFQLEKQRRCARELSATGRSFQFKFAPFTKAPVPPAYGPHDQKTSWYPVPDTSYAFRSCFMKVAFKITDNFDIRVIATSKLDATTEFGTYNVGPTPDPRRTDLTVRAACFEFRCPGLVHDGATTHRDLPTRVDVRFSTANKGMVCTLEEVKTGLNLTAIPHPDRDTVGFTFYAEARDQYGPSKGVYVYNSPARETVQQCQSGDDYEPGSMQPLNNYAVMFKCT